MNPTFLWWIFSGGLLCSLLLSTLAYALRTMSRVQLEEELIARHRPRAATEIFDAQLDLALTASTLRLVASTTVIVAVAWYFLELYHGDPHPLKVFGWTLLITVPSLLVFSVAVPQAWANYAGEHLLAMTWPGLRILHALFWPVIRVLKVFDEIVRRLAGVSLGEDPDAAMEHAEQEILSAVAEGEAEGTFDEDQKKMIEGVISFRDLQVGQIMTPRTDVVAVEVNAGVLEARDTIVKDGLSRVPLYEGTLDNIVGILYAKDLLQFLNIAGGAADEDERMELRKVMRPPLFVPRTKPLRDLLREFRVQQVHMAVVLDEYGGTSGLVTTEDILEEIVGDIADEYERPAAQELRRVDETTVEVDARMPVSDVNRALDVNFPEDADYQTMGGFVIATLGVIPVKGDHLTHDGVEVTVMESEPRRVKRLRLDLPRQAAPVTEEAAVNDGHGA